MLLEERVGQPTTEAEAEQLALELYGLHVVAKALPGEYDDNFHLTVKSALADQAKLANSVAPKLASPSPPAAAKAITTNSVFRLQVLKAAAGSRQRMTLRMTPFFKLWTIL